MTKADSFPLPRIEDCVDRVGSARYVSKFDLLKVALTPRAQEISAFITPSGLYQYTRMSFGLRYAPSSFQRLMNHVVAGLEGCAVYLDDVVVYADTWAIHLARIRSLFERLAAATLTVNLAKCEFTQATVIYLGKVVGQGQVRTVRAKVLAIDAKFPSSQVSSPNYLKRSNAFPRHDWVLSQLLLFFYHCGSSYQFVKEFSEVCVVC